jgi:hypothetical protein
LSGFRDFSSVLATSDTFWYAIASFPGSEWEVGLGTYSALNTITRTTVLASSNAGSAVVFSAGTKEVFITAAASKFLQADAAGSYGNFTAGTITAALTGNAGTATTFSTTRTNYKGVTDAAVAGQLMWKHYGNNHTIFDASNSTSPQGGAISNTNAATAWIATYPTLMGWNGTTTYGVRVDSARVTDALSTASGSAPSYSARAWVNFNGVTVGTFVGGTTTFARTSPSTTAVCTTTNPHGLITGNNIYASSGIIIFPGSYTVTVTGANTFTIVTSASTTVSGTLSVFVSNIRGDGNVSTVADEGVGIYLINFSVAMPDTNYAALFGWGIGSNPPSDTSNDGFANIGEQTVYYVRVYFEAANDTSLDRAYMSAAIFR